MTKLIKHFYKKSKVKKIFLRRFALGGKKFSTFILKKYFPPKIFLGGLIFFSMIYTAIENKNFL